MGRLDLTFVECHNNLERVFYSGLNKHGCAAGLKEGKVGVGGFIGVSVDFSQPYINGR